MNEHLSIIARLRRQDSPAASALAVPTDDPTAVRVPLFGKHGAGFFMTLDAADWPLVQREWGSIWTLLPNGNGRSYVSACLRRCGQVDQPGSGDTARLARLLVGAGRGEMVVYRDGDTLNLRRSNLLFLDRKGAKKWRKEQAVASVGAVRH